MDEKTLVTETVESGFEDYSMVNQEKEESEMKNGGLFGKVVKGILIVGGLAAAGFGAYKYKKNKKSGYTTTNDDICEEDDFGYDCEIDPDFNDFEELPMEDTTEVNESDNGTNKKGK